MAAPSEPRWNGYAEIAVDAAIGPDRTLTYGVPRGMPLVPGQPVLVPLLSRRVGGIVIALSPTTDIAGIRPVLQPQHPAPLLSSGQLELARWLSRETRCSLYEAAALMLPMDYRRRLLRYVELSPADDVPGGAALAPAEERVVGLLRRRGRLSQDALQRALGDGVVNPLRRLVRAGRLVESWELSRQRARPAMSQSLRLAVAADKAQEAAEGFPPESRRRALMEAVLVDELLDAAAARRDFGGDTVRRLVANRLLALQQHRRQRDPLAGASPRPDTPPTLSGEQHDAVERVVDSITRGAGDTFLLHGATGSGKTEVYLRAFAACRAAGKRALLLTPEISLTPQLVSRVQARFPGRVGLLHSALTAGEQYDTWWRAYDGGFDILVGTRSALFAPVADLGLIVLDEEHDWSYKQSDAQPRYHARATAVQFARLTGATVVLGSATPDVATYRAAQRGRIRLLTLPHRIRPGPAGPEPAPLARVEVVDMRDELRDGVRSIFSRALSGALVDTLQQGGQAILFINRRGAAGAVQCRACGHVLRCRNCATPLTYHAEGDRLLCHRCGRRGRAGGPCPQCRSLRIRHLGLGTQRVVQEVERLTGVTPLRWDRDAARERDAHRDIMERFARGEAQVLVGTQMVAQGLDLPNVTFVGVVLADLGLNVPDVRANERTFQLLCQVAGRAGRGAAPGLVVVQTYAPERYPVQAGVRQDYQLFYEQEIAVRRELRNPPFARLARFRMQHSGREYAAEEARRFGEALRIALAQMGLIEVDVIGPAPAYPPRLRGRYRWQVTLRLPPTTAVTMPQLLAALPISPTWSVDVDPDGAD